MPPIRTAVWLEQGCQTIHVEFASHLSVASDCSLTATGSKSHEVRQVASQRSATRRKAGDETRYRHCAARVSRSRALSVGLQVDTDWLGEALARDSHFADVLPAV